MPTITRPQLSGQHVGALVEGALEGVVEHAVLHDDDGDAADGQYHRGDCHGDRRDPDANAARADHAQPPSGASR